MILPGSYANGFAPRDGQPLYPELWRGCGGAWAPCLGPTGLALRDWSGYAFHGTFSNLTAAAAWQPRSQRYSIAFSGGTTEAVTGNTGGVSSAVRPITLSFWFQSSSVAAARHWIYQNNNAASNPNLAIVIERISDTSHRLAIYSGAYTYSSAFAWDLALHHYAVTWLADGSVSFYRDGLLVSSSTRAVSGTPDETWQFNRLGTGFGGFSMTGNLFEFWTHRRELSPSQITRFAIRPGIAFELAPRRRASSGIAFNRRRRLLVGAGT